MARTSDQRDPFRQRLRALRVGAGLSQKQVVDQLEANGGSYVTPQALGQYESGHAAPSRLNAIALGKILDDASLPELLGYNEDPGTSERLERIEARLNQQHALLQEVLRRLESAAAEGSGR